MMYQLKYPANNPTYAFVAAENALAGKTLQLALKRGLDLVISGIAILLLLPFLVLAAIVIRLDSPGPIFYRQRRAGYRDIPFEMIKLRSMRIDQDDVMAAEQAEAAKSGLLVKRENDPRVTRAGRFLRATSLDELPQLFNVFKGEMSLVGPRPLMEFMLEPHPEFRHVRALMRPGLTGLWQIRARSNNRSAAGMISHDLEYLHRFSLALDLHVLLKTPAVVLSGEGAC
jgi:lipopolysaccharide/colanic/teichoic acid biosynthesis glycosyltransferase